MSVPRISLTAEPLIFFLGLISLWREVISSLKIVINQSGLMRSYIVKENHIGRAVREIFWYKQTDTLTERHPVAFK